MTISKKTTSELQSIVFSGGSIVVNGKDYTTSALQSLALIAKSHSAKIIIKHASSLTTSQCKSIAFSAGGQGVVTFDFTE